jgi:RNA polymerase sigma factor (sigma-70 family)
MATTQAGAILGHIRKLVAAPYAVTVADRELLHQFATQGSEAAFEELVRRHGAMVLWVCRRQLHHQQDAEDVFQATFLTLARKAGSIRKQESVGCWLHGVAHRLALRAETAAARRRAHERRVADRPAPDPVAEISLREAEAMLDEELTRLPEKYRAPLLLCYLESATRDEAAQQLGWSVATLKRRLERGRELLRHRLVRRGLTLSSALLATTLSQGSAQATVPAGLAAATVYAAGKGMATGPISSEVVALVEGYTKTLLVAQLKSIGALLLALSLCFAGASVLAHRAFADKVVGAPPSSPAMRPAVAAPAPAAPSQQAADTLTVCGQVLDPEGKPIAGAKLYLWTNTVKSKADLLVRATTGEDGRFQFTATQQDVARAGVVIASSKDHGPDWTDLAKFPKGGPVTLRLARDDVPINGRLLDLQGRPLAGVTVQVRRLEKRANNGDLTPWIETKRKWARGDYTVGVNMKELAAEALPIPTSVSTGADGRFCLTGFGRERVVHLKFHGNAIENTYVEVITRAGPLVGLYTGNENVTSYGATFERVVGPSKPIVGTVRERRTGKPLAGISVSTSGHFRGEAVTDARGHYRIDGTGKQKAYHVSAGTFPYFSSSKAEISDTPGFDPLVVDFELDRGIVLTVRLTDKTTGKPVRGSVEHYIRADNPYQKDFPSLRGYGGGRDVGADGLVRVLAIPGRGWLTIQAGDTNRFVPPTDSWNDLLLPTVGGTLVPGQHHRVVPLDLPEKDPQVTTYDIALEPGQTRSGTVLGSDGKPLAGAYVAGRRPVIVNGRDFSPEFFRQNSLKGASFTAFGLNPRRARNLVFFHGEKKLGKVQPVRGDEKGPLTVRLEPLGAVAGRLLDQEGRPRAGLTVRAKLSHGNDVRRDMPWELVEGMGPLLVVTQTTDRDGRFRLDGLLPGLKYRLTTEGDTYVLEDLTAEPAKTKDLGDLKSNLVPGK